MHLADVFPKTPQWLAAATIGISSGQRHRGGRAAPLAKLTKRFEHSVEQRIAACGSANCRISRAARTHIKRFRRSCSSRCGAARWHVDTPNPCLREAPLAYRRSVCLTVSHSIYQRTSIERPQPAVRRVSSTLAWDAIRDSFSGRKARGYALARRGCDRCAAISGCGRDAQERGGARAFRSSRCRRVRVPRRAGGRLLNSIAIARAQNIPPESALPRWGCRARSCCVALDP
jgi:hypothetical protein